MPNMYSNEIIPEFESLIDQISDKFFNYENRKTNLSRYSRGII